MANSWYQSKENRGVPDRNVVGRLVAKSKKSRKTVGRFEAEHEIRKSADIAAGRSSAGRSLSPEEIEAFMKGRP